MYRIIAFALFILWVFALIDCLRSLKSDQKKTLWILVLLIPVIGLVLYFLIGRRE